MATYSGNSGTIKITYPATGFTLAEVRDWSIEQSANRIDSTVMGDEWTTGKITQKSWTGSINLYYDGTANETLIGSQVTVFLYPLGETSGLWYWEGDAHITSVNTSASFDGMIELSVSVEGTGPLEYKQV